jgi:hypothetical protein
MSLRYLMLDLHYDQRPVQPRHVAKTEELYLRRTLINAAMDEKLALGIFNPIHANQSSRCLQYLRAVPFGSQF